MSNRIILSNYPDDRKKQHNNSIVLNAYWDISGTSGDTSGCFIHPIRDVSGKSFPKALWYNPATKEVGYADASGGGGGGGGSGGGGGGVGSSSKGSGPQSIWEAGSTTVATLCPKWLSSSKESDMD
jgi:hypothetical protein